MEYILISLISFVLGIIFDRYILTRFKLVVKVEKNTPASINHPSPASTENKYFKAESLINYVKIHDSLPIRISSSVLYGLKEIAKSPNWQAKENGLIDENTKVNILIDEENYHGSWIEQKADGSVEEYME